MKTVLKILAILAAIAGAVYVIATYGERIVAWCRKLLSTICWEDCCCDEDMYEVTCPACENTITTDFDVIASGSIACPNCGETLEFDLSALEDCDCGCCDDE